MLKNMFSVLNRYFSIFKPLGIKYQLYPIRLNLLYENINTNNICYNIWKREKQLKEVEDSI